MNFPSSHCFPVKDLSINVVLSNTDFMMSMMGELNFIESGKQTSNVQSSFSTKKKRLYPDRDVYDSRRYCFPHLESRENFISLHSDASYATDFDIPFLISEDNSKPKVLFVIRDPVNRFYSHYKEIYKYMSSFISRNEINIAPNFVPRVDVLIEIGTSVLGPLSKLHEVSSHSDIDKSPTQTLSAVINSYYNVASRCKILLSLSPSKSCSLLRRSSIFWKEHKNKTNFVDYFSDIEAGVIDFHTYNWLLLAMPLSSVEYILGSNSSCSICSLFTVTLALSYELFLHSIYLPPILHYGNTLGMENVLVINSDELNPGNSKRFKRLMSAIYMFLDLPTFDIFKV